MADVRVDETVENAEVLAEQLLDSILVLENQNVIGEQETDECIYHLNKLAALLGLNVDLDTFNDEYLNEREGND